MTLEQLKSSPAYHKHHSARRRAYASRKTGETQPVPYKGKYGVGYVTYSPSWDSTRYCWVNYYIEVTR